MKKFKLRDYQADDLKRINKEIKAGHKRVLYSLMTAGGKTVVLHEQVSRWLRKGLRGCVLVHTRALLNQTCAVFSDIPHGIIAGGIKSDPDKKLQICMVQSLARRGGKAFDFIVVDEAHHATASTWAKILADSTEAIILGVTATPFRHDNRGLGQAGFTTLVEGPEVSWLTEQGFLSPVEYYAPTDIDMTGVKKVGGDYEKKESSRRANKPTITGSAVEHYKRHANGQRALVFCADIKHVLSVTKKFKKAWLNAAFIHGKMATDEREDVLLQFAESKDMILVSCELIGEGLDVPAVACVILLRPTASLVRFIQQVGRGLRVVDGKKHVVVLDHVGNIRLGHPHVRREVDLNGVERKAKSLDENSPKSYLRTCPKCKRVETADVPKCSTCGHKFKVVVRGAILKKSGSLKRIDGLKSDVLHVSKINGSLGVHYVCTINSNSTYLGTNFDVAIKCRDFLLSMYGSRLSALDRDDLLFVIRRFLFENSKGKFKIKSNTRQNGKASFYLSGTGIKLGCDFDTAKLAGQYIVDEFIKNGYKLPEDKALLKRQAFAVSDKNFIGLRGISNSVSINGVKCHLTRSIHVATAAREWLINWYLANGCEWPEPRKIPALVKKAISEPSVSSRKKPKPLSMQQKFLMASGRNIRHISKNKNLNRAIFRWLEEWYKSNGCEFTHKKDDMISLIRRARYESSGTQIPIRSHIVNGKENHKINIKHRSVFCGEDISIANAARDYLLKFYESNNYEWPPKSEVPALVKKALEHARSTVE